MAIRHDLFLHEKVLLLGPRDDTGKYPSGNWMLCAIGGAILAELRFANRITFDPPHPSCETGTGERVRLETTARGKAGSHGRIQCLRG